MRLFKRLTAAALSAVMTCSTAISTAAAAPVVSAVGNDSDNYARLLQYSLYFYDAQFCGDDVTKSSAVTWRGNCHTDDDVIGGYHDAGDHVMFGISQGYSASLLGWSYYEFKDAYEETMQTEHYKLIMDRFCDFFKRSVKLRRGSVSELLYQKGSGTEDHAYWGAPENQSGKREMVWTKDTACDVAAEYAAALALNYLNFGDEDDLRYAEALYEYSTKYNDCENEAAKDYYSDPSLDDEQAYAAGWLYLATNEEKYLNDCKDKQSDIDYPDCWGTRTLGAAEVLAYITEDWSAVNDYLDSQTKSSSYYSVTSYGNNAINESLQFTALVSSRHSEKSYLSWCRRQTRYILGDNEHDTCFVTGFADNSTKNAFHRGASGYEDDSFSYETKEYSAANGHTLVGALVSGPDTKGEYADELTNFKSNDVGLTFNAALTAAAAGLYAFAPTGSIDSEITEINRLYPSKSGSGAVIELDIPVDYSKLDYSTYGVELSWADIGIGANLVPKSITFNLSAEKEIGEIVYAFSSQTYKDAGGNAIYTDNASEHISERKGSVAWELSDALKKTLTPGSKEHFTFHIFWVDCQRFNIDSISIAYENAAVPVTTSQAPAATKPATTTKAPTTTRTSTTTKALATTRKPVTTEPTTVVYPTEFREFKFGRDNWGFTNNDMNHVQGYYLTDEHREKLFSGLSNTDAEAINRLLSKKWSGSCYGMAATSILSSYDILRASTLMPGASYICDIDLPNSDIKSLINYYHAFQASSLISQKTNIALLEQSEIEKLGKLQKCLKDNSPTLLTFFSPKGGHAVVAYGIEKGEWEYDGRKYKERVLVYDNNYSVFSKDTCLYFDMEEEIWCIPRYKAYSYNGDSLGFLTDDLTYINYHGLIGGNSNPIPYHTFYSTLNSAALSTTFDVRIISEDDNDAPVYNAAGADDFVIYRPIGEDDESGCWSAAVRDSSAGYSLMLDAPDSVDMSFTYPDSLLGVSASKAADVTFDPKGAAGFSGNKSNYRLSLVFNEGSYPTDWYNFSVRGSDAVNASLKKAEGGYILSASSLKDAEIKGMNGNDTARLYLSTEHKDVFLYEIDEKTIGVKVDANNDGVFEKDITPAGSKVAGDANCDGIVSIADATAVLQAIGNPDIYGLSGQMRLNADVDGSDGLTGMDALIIQRVDAKIVKAESLPLR